MTASRRGFTLLELLIAVAVLGLVIVLLDQGVAFGLRTTAVQRQAEDRHGDLDAVDRLLRHLIDQAAPSIPPEPPRLRGTADALTLVSELQPGERIDATLLVAGDQLRLRWTPHRHVERFGPPPEPQQRALLTGVRALDLAYFNGTAWSPTWNADRLPLLVRATLRFTDPNRHWPPIEAAPVR